MEICYIPIVSVRGTDSNCGEDDENRPQDEKALSEVYLSKNESKKQNDILIWSKEKW